MPFSFINGTWTAKTELAFFFFGCFWLLFNITTRQFSQIIVTQTYFHAFVSLLYCFRTLPFLANHSSLQYSQSFPVKQKLCQAFDHTFPAIKTTADLVGFLTCVVYHDHCWVYSSVVFPSEHGCFVLHYPLSQICMVIS